jgi:hypothetical protein
MNTSTNTTGLTDVTTQAELDQLRDAVETVSAYTPGERGGNDTWGRLLTVLAVINRLQASAVELAGWVSHHGVVEAQEGLPLEAGLGLLGQQTISDRKMLLAAADVLETMPSTFSRVPGRAAVMEPGPRDRQCGQEDQS